MALLADIVAAFIISIIAFSSGPLLTVNDKNSDYNAAVQTQAMLQHTIDTARSNATATGTPGILDNDGATISISGNILTIYPQRPINATAIGNQEQAFLPSSLNAQIAPVTKLTSTFFISPNGTITMQDNWQFGQLMNPVAGCPHNTIHVGTHYTLTIDCQTGMTTLQ